MDRTNLECRDDFGICIICLSGFVWMGLAAEEELENLSEFSDFGNESLVLTLFKIQICLPIIDYFLSLILCSYSSHANYLLYVISIFCLYFLHVIFLINVLIYVPIYYDQNWQMLTAEISILMFTSSFLAIGLTFPFSITKDTLACLKNCFTKLSVKHRLEGGISISIFLQ